MPGRKTDVKDAEWIAQLVRHGLVTKSFVPPPAIRDLREMVRHRRTLIETRTAVRNRVLKLLEGANIKLSGVASDVFGVSGMAMLEALAAGTSNATEMAGLARGRMRRKHAALEAALDGRMREHQCFLLGMHLRSLNEIDRDLEALDARIETQLEPYQAQHRLLMQIPGVDWVTAASIIAEIGTDMDVFASARRLAAWAGVAPGNYESAGKPKGAGTRRGNVFLSGSLEQLRRQPLDEQGQRQLARAEWGAYQAARLTRQVLFQARGADGAPSVVDLNTVAGGFAAIMGQDVSQGVQLSANLAPGPLPVRVDAGLLELVLLNLVRNAADAMAQPFPGGGTREAGARPSGGKVVLQTKGPRLDSLGDRLAVEVAVSDTATGMVPDLAGRAADAFFTTKPPGKGTGLGLWIAHRFASAHGGKISIKTAPGRGTTVRLSLPCAGDAEPS